MLSSVMLRQNPHNVHEWHKRVKLFGGNTSKQIRAYTEGIQSVDCHKVCVSSKALMNISPGSASSQQQDEPSWRCQCESGCDPKPKTHRDCAGHWQAALAVVRFCQVLRSPRRPSQCTDHLSESHRGGSLSPNLYSTRSTARRHSCRLTLSGRYAHAFCTQTLSARCRFAVLGAGGIQVRG